MGADKATSVTFVALVSSGTKRNRSRLAYPLPRLLQLQLLPHVIGGADQIAEPNTQLVQSGAIIRRDVRPWPAALIVVDDTTDRAAAEMSHTAQRGVLAVADLELLPLLNDRLGTHA